MLWDGTYLWMGGSNQNSITNPTAYGQTGTETNNVWRFNPIASTPKLAWQQVQISSGMSGHFGFVKNADGTITFRNWPTVRTVNPSTLAVTLGRVGGGPTSDAYSSFRPCVRDAATNKYYELHQTSIGPYAAQNKALYEAVSGALVKRCEMPTWLSTSSDNDFFTTPIIIDGHLYYTEGGYNFCRVNLTTFVVDQYTTPGGPGNRAHNGLWGRWGYVPQVKAFVVLKNSDTAVWVFRPPASWGL